jgi:hypothetical protein
LPEAVIIINPEITMRRKATPPPIPTPHLSKNPAKSLKFPTGIQPMAVFIDSAAQPACGPVDVLDRFEFITFVWEEQHARTGEMLDS